VAPEILGINAGATATATLVEEPDHAGRGTRDCTARGESLVGGELVKARGLAIVLRQPATA